MKTEVIKRNYLTVILSLLREETSKNEKRYTIEQIRDRMGEKYSIKPNRKTVMNVIEDLKELGYDIKNIRGKKGGYYLDERELSLSDVSIISDAIEAMRLPADTKIELYEKLQSITGIPTKKFDPVLYGDDGFEFFTEKEIDEYKEVITNISLAIEDKKKVLIDNLIALHNFFFEEPSEKAMAYYSCDNNGMLGKINPLKFIHNNKNEPALLFYVVSEGETYLGAIELGTFQYAVILEERMDYARNLDSLICEINFNDYESAKEYRNKKKTVTAFFVCSNPEKHWLELSALKDYCTSITEKSSVYDNKEYMIKFPLGNFNKIEGFFIECAGFAKVIKRSLDNDTLLFDEIYEKFERLETAYGNRDKT